MSSCTEGEGACQTRFFVEFTLNKVNVLRMTKSEGLRMAVQEVFSGEDILSVDF